MRPLVIEWLAPALGPLAPVLVPGWFAMVAMAGLLAALWTLRRARRAGEDTEAVLGACAAAYLSAVAAGIIVPAIYYMVAGAIAGRGFHLRWAGMVSYCGYVAGGLAVVLYLRRRATLTPLRFADLAAPGLGLALISARLGCFLAGCDYGQVSAGPLAMRFPQGSPAWHAHVGAGWVPRWRGESLPVHPTQLYEAGLGLLLCGLALILGRTAWARGRDGRVFATIVAGYAIGRLAIESLRGDAGRGLLGSISSAQVFAAIVLVALAAVLWRRRRLATGAAIAVVAALALATSPAAAQPRPEPAEPAEPAEPELEPLPSPYPTGHPAPASPAPPAGQTAPSPYPVAPGQPLPDGKPRPVPITAAESPAPAAGDDADRFGPEVSGFVAGGAPLNRRAGQVPALGGVSLTATMPIAGSLRLGADLDSLANSVATHASLIAVSAIRFPAGDKLAISARGGFGVTVINFSDPSFTDQVSAGARAGIGLHYDLSPRWAATVRPADFDVTGAPGTGGPIFTWQLRVGITYRHLAATAPATASPPAAAPPAAARSR